jgi:AcrR family transcriptional regulator
MAEHSKEDLSAKQRLLDVAARLFAAHGLEGTSVRDIAKEAGLNLSLVSYYFGGKEGLYLELLRAFAAEVKVKMEQIVTLFENEATDPESLRKILGVLVESYSGIRESYPHMGKIMQRERIAGLPLTREIYEKTFTPMVESLVQQMVKAQKKNLIRKDLNPVLIVIFLQESIIGFHNLMDCAVGITHSPLVKTKNFKDFQNQLVNIFLNGILA